MCKLEYMFSNLLGKWALVILLSDSFFDLTSGPDATQEEVSDDRAVNVIKWQRLNPGSDQTPGKGASAAELAKWKSASQEQFNETAGWQHLNSFQSTGVLC